MKRFETCTERCTPEHGHSGSCLGKRAFRSAFLATYEVHGGQDQVELWHRSCDDRVRDRDGLLYWEALPLTVAMDLAADHAKVCPAMKASTRHGR